jgi:hypothetical protein
MDKKWLQVRPPNPLPTLPRLQGRGEDTAQLLLFPSPSKGEEAGGGGQHRAQDHAHASADSAPFGGRSHILPGSGRRSPHR